MPKDFEGPPNPADNPEGWLEDVSDYHDEMWGGDDCSCDYFTEQGELVTTRNFDELEAAMDDLLEARTLAAKKDLSMNGLAEMIRASIQGRAAKYHKALADEGFCVSDQLGLVEEDYDDMISGGIVDVVLELRGTS